MRIGFKNGSELFFCDEVYFSIFQLLFHTANDWSSKYDIANGTKSYNENFFQMILKPGKLKQQSYKNNKAPLAAGL